MLEERANCKAPAQPQAHKALSPVPLWMLSVSLDAAHNEANELDSIPTPPLLCQACTWLLCTYRAEEAKPPYVHSSGRINTHPEGRQQIAAELLPASGGH
jgi:hypothetical protein